MIDLRMETLIESSHNSPWDCPVNNVHNPSVLTKLTHTSLDDKVESHFCMSCGSEWDVIAGVSVEYVSIAPEMPEWSTAPEWANYRCRNRNGVWVWFESHPHPNNQAGRWETYAGQNLPVHIVDDHMFVATDWRNTLTARK